LVKISIANDNKSAEAIVGVKNVIKSLFAASKAQKRFCITSLTNEIKTYMFDHLKLAIIRG
tara:strand:+ start:283 stop:465 length:183 start_codon:yes stop_codon:yes gene_type:complete